MGFRFRKSINLGGFRINLSKSGIGYSFGVPGMRYTKKAKGGHRATLSIPGTGISYVKDSHKHKNVAKSAIQQSSQKSQDEHKPYYYDIQSNQCDFVAALNNATKKNKLYNSLLIFAIIGICIGIAIGASGIQNKIIGLAITGIAFTVIGIISLLLIPKNAKIKLDIKFESQEQLTLYKSFIDNIKILSTNNEFFLTQNDTILTTQNIEKDPLNKILDSEIDACCIYLENFYLYFLPNMIIAFQNNVWKGIDYNDINLETKDIEKTFYDYVPESINTEILHTSYEHINKDGSPNMRYSRNNSKIFICAYAKITIKSGTGLILNLVSSDRHKSELFVLAAKEFIKSFSNWSKNKSY